MNVLGTVQISGASLETCLLSPESTSIRTSMLIAEHRPSSPRTPWLHSSEPRLLEADAIEFDVHVTSDGVPVVFHDYDLARTTSGIGYVFEQTIDQVRLVDAGSWLDPRYAEEKVPLLEEVLNQENGPTSRCRACRGSPADRTSRDVQSRTDRTRSPS